MTTPLTVECRVEFHRVTKGRKQLEEAPTEPRLVVPPGRVPRVARWMALAIRFEQLLCEGQVTNYAALAELGHVTRARITQIMNLLNLAPDIQQELLFLPRTECGRDPIILRDLQGIAAVLDWCQQREKWRRLSAD